MSVVYQEYLKSEAWKSKRSMVLKHWDNRCALCNSDNQPLHLHHRTYKNLGDEGFSDVIPLCASCHKIHHDSGSNRIKAMEWFLWIVSSLVDGLGRWPSDDEIGEYLNLVNNTLNKNE